MLYLWFPTAFFFCNILFIRSASSEVCGKTGGGNTLPTKVFDGFDEDAWSQRGKDDKGGPGTDFIPEAWGEAGEEEGQGEEEYGNWGSVDTTVGGELHHQNYHTAKDNVKRGTKVIFVITFIICASAIGMAVWKVTKKHKKVTLALPVVMPRPCGYPSKACVSLQCIQDYTPVSSGREGADAYGTEGPDEVSDTVSL